MIEIKIVSSLINFSSSETITKPSPSTGAKSTSKPCVFNHSAVFFTAGCSTLETMM